MHMKKYEQAKLEIEEFLLNADIATASTPGTTSGGGGGTTESGESTTGASTSATVGGQQGGGLLSAGIEFELGLNGNDEI